MVIFRSTIADGSGQFSVIPGWRDLVREPPPGSNILQIYEG